MGCAWLAGAAWGITDGGSLYMFRSGKNWNADAAVRVPRIRKPDPEDLGLRLETGLSQLQKRFPWNHVTGSPRRSRHLEDHFPVVLALQEKFVGFFGVFYRERLAHDGVQLPVSNPAGELLPCLIHQVAFARQVSQPQSLHAGSLGVERTKIKLRLFAGCRAVLNYLPEVAQASNALGSVFATEHFEDGIQALAPRQFFDRFFVIKILVVDRVLQSKFLHARQLLVRRRGPVHLRAQNLSDLDGGRADSSPDRVDQDAPARPAVR